MSKFDVRRFAEVVFGKSTPPDLYIWVPCGKCPECLRRRSRMWRLRLLHEMKCHSHSIFITLSVSPKYYDSVVQSPSTYLRRFWDNLRKKRKVTGWQNKMVKHWLISEGGVSKHDTHRYHFHGILFGVEKTDLTYDQIRDCWPYGHMWIGDAQPGAGVYCTKYITKCQSFGRIFSSPFLGDSMLRQMPFNEKLCSYPYQWYAPNTSYRYPVSPHYSRRVFDKFLECEYPIYYNRYLAGFYDKTVFAFGQEYKNVDAFFDRYRPVFLDDARRIPGLLEKLLQSRLFRRQFNHLLSNEDLQTPIRPAR